MHVEAYEWEARKSYVESRVIDHQGKGGLGPLLFQIDGLGGCMTPLDESPMTESIGMGTIRWVKRTRDRSLIIESIGMVMI